VSETPSYADILHVLRVRLAGSPQLRDQTAEDIAHDLMTNGYLSTEPDPALVRRALAEIRDDDGGAAWANRSGTKRWGGRSRPLGGSPKSAKGWPSGATQKLASGTSRRKRWPCCRRAWTPGVRIEPGSGVSENQRRLLAAGYEFEPSRAGKHFWRHPNTGQLLPEEYAAQLVREEEERRLEEAGWERVGGGRETYWRRPDSGRLYPRGPAYDVMRSLEEEGE
jgi:hypothetical protein